MKKNIILIAIICASLFIGYRLGIKKEQVEQKPLDEIVLDSLRMGCEFGVLKNCNPKEQDYCKKFCHEFLDDEIIMFMKKKGEAVIKNKK
jgi:hypothetical protein